jgi:hypothetical protein
MKYLLTRGGNNMELDKLKKLLNEGKPEAKADELIEAFSQKAELERQKLVADIAKNEAEKQVAQQKKNKRFARLRLNTLEKNRKLTNIDPLSGAPALEEDVGLVADDNIIPLSKDGVTVIKLDGDTAPSKPMLEPVVKAPDPDVDPGFDGPANDPSNPQVEVSISVNNKEETTMPKSPKINIEESMNELFKILKEETHEGEEAKSEAIVPEIEAKASETVAPSPEATVEVKPEEAAKETEVSVTSTSIKIEIPVASGESVTDGLTAEANAVLQEGLRIVYGILSGKALKEEETVEVPVDAEAEVKVEDDKIVVEIPVESPKDEITPEENEALQEALKAISFVLKEGIEGSTDIGDVAVEPVHDEGEAKEMEPVASNDDSHPADEHKQSEDLKSVEIKESTEATVSGEGVTKAEAEAVKHVEVLGDKGQIEKVEHKDETKVVDGHIKIKDHDHGDAENAQVRSAIHIKENEITPEVAAELEKIDKELAAAGKIKKPQTAKEIITMVNNNEKETKEVTQPVKTIKDPKKINEEETVEVPVNPEVETEVKDDKIEVEVKTAETQPEETVEVPTDVEADVQVSSDSIKIELPISKDGMNEIDTNTEAGLQEALRVIYSIFRGVNLTEEETVEVPADAEAEVKVEGDKLVIEIPVESPKEVISAENAAVLQEMINYTSFLLLERSPYGPEIMDDVLPPPYTPPSTPSTPPVLPTFPDGPGFGDVPPVIPTTIAPAAAEPNFWTNAMTGFKTIGDTIGAGVTAAGEMIGAGATAAGAAFSALSPLAASAVLGVPVLALTGLMLNPKFREFAARKLGVGRTAQLAKELASKQKKISDKTALARKMGVNQVRIDKLKKDAEFAAKEKVAGRPLTFGNKLLAKTGLGNFNLFGWKPFYDKRVGNRLKTARDEYVSKFSGRDAEFKKKGIKFDPKTGEFEAIDPTNAKAVAAANTEYANFTSGDDFSDYNKGLELIKSDVEAVKKANQAEKERLAKDLETKVKEDEIESEKEKIYLNSPEFKKLNWQMAKDKLKTFAESVEFNFDRAYDLLETLNLSQDQKVEVVLEAFRREYFSELRGVILESGFSTNKVGVEKFLLENSVSLTEEEKKEMVDSLNSGEVVKSFEKHNEGLRSEDIKQDNSGKPSDFRSSLSTKSSELEPKNIKESAELGSVAAEPVHDEKSAVEHTPELENKDVFPADEHKQSEEVKEVIVKEELSPAHKKAIKANYTSSGETIKNVEKGESESPLLTNKIPKLENNAKKLRDEGNIAMAKQVEKRIDSLKQVTGIMPDSVLEEKVELTDADKKTLVKDASKEQLERLIDATGSTQKKIVNPGVTTSAPVKTNEAVEAPRKLKIKGGK